MKNFLSSIPNRIKAIYIVWAFIHFILLLFSGNFFHYNKYFFPIGSNSFQSKRLYPTDAGYKHVIEFTLSKYDYTEFLIYILTPIVIYSIIKLWNKKDAKEPDSN